MRATYPRAVYGQGNGRWNSARMGTTIGLGLRFRQVDQEGFEPTTTGA